LEQTNADDDEDYKPEPRSASKTAEKKHDFKFEIGQEEQQSDFDLSSTTSIDKKLKGRIKEELIGILSKKQKKDQSPMHPTIPLKPSTFVTSPPQPTADQQFFINILASFKADIDKKLRLLLIGNLENRKQLKQNRIKYMMTKMTKRKPNPVMKKTVFSIFNMFDFIFLMYVKMDKNGYKIKYN
jgi:hypothetical protein